MPLGLNLNGEEALATEGEIQLDMEVVRASVLQHNGFLCTESHEKGLVIKKVVNVLRKISLSCLCWLHFEGLNIHQAVQFQGILKIIRQWV